MRVRFLLLVAVSLTACKNSRQPAADGEVSLVQRQQANKELERAIANNEVLRAALAAVDSGHPWQATQRLAPLVSDAKQRSPAATLLAARAAAQWGGWSEVDRLLARESWVDTQFGGEGRELLARSALERGVDSTALKHTSAAVQSARDAEARYVRQVLHARALERNNKFDSAAAMYDRAAEGLRPVRDWLYLRVAGNESDERKRAKVLSGVTSASAKPRVAWTDAQARERFGDAAGAAARYAEVGAVIPALRLRLAAASDSADRLKVKNELMAIVRRRAGSFDARGAVEVLDKGFPSLSGPDELAIARSTAVSGPPSRAVTAYNRALNAAIALTPNDRIAFGQSLVRMGRSREALTQFAMVQGPLAAQAGYLRARVLLNTSSNDATRAALREVVARFPGDSAAGSSLYLLADLATDAGNDAEARSLFEQVYRSYPTHPRAASARFHAGVIAYAAGDYRGAAAKFDSLWTLMPRAEDALAARYWSGRAWAAAGDKAQASQRWRDVVAQQPMSYYGFASAARSGEKPWSLPAGSDAVPRVAAVDSAILRASLLTRLGMDTEARFEYEALEEAAAKNPDRALATAHAFATNGQAPRGIRLAQRLADGGQRDARVYRALFPLVDPGEIARTAQVRKLDPALVAGLVRQESSFNPRAISVANARGLMQLLPPVGAEISRSLRFPVWHQALLFDPDANLQLGTTHLASYVAQYGALPRVLAAYNAGGSRVTRWSAKSGMNDPELFAERIPFVETRDYVRIVQRNAHVYRTLWGQELGLKN